MAESELKSGMQWGMSIPTLNEIFNKLAEKIDDVNENINAIRDDLISKADYGPKIPIMR